MREIFYILYFLFASGSAIAQTGLYVRFENYAGNKKIVLNDSTYQNNFGEHYSVSKLKYYVSDIHFVTTPAEIVTPNIFLIDVSKENSLILPKPAGPVVGIQFLLGVDSSLNCSGAQSGALDPLNDMFWTWDNGYVMFKLEGTSDMSTADNHRIEQHIGGYKGIYKTMRTVFLPLKPDAPNESEFTGIVLKLDLNAYWQGRNNIHILEFPVLSASGINASNAADNFPGMFSVKSYHFIK